MRRYLWEWVLTIPKGAMPSSAAFAMGAAVRADDDEVEGVVGLICALQAWHRAADWVIAEGLARQLLAECKAHACTQGWLDEMMSQAARGQVDMMTTMTGAQAVAGLICAIWAWQRYCLVQAMLEAAVTAFMRTQEPAMRPYSCRACNAAVGAPHHPTCVLLAGNLL